MSRTPIAALMCFLAAVGHAADINFATDPFEGTNALTNPGRDIVGNELFTDFLISTDVFRLDRTTFGVGPSLVFLSDTADNLPAAGGNVVVLRTTDNDNNAMTPFLAGTAANLIADALDTPGPGFFIYFNSNLRMPRLVYSTDLSVNTADLKVLARMENLEDNPGSLAEFSSANFLITDVPEASSVSMTLAGAVLIAIGYVRRRHRTAS